MGDWAVLEILEREDGKGSVAKLQVISHSLESRTAADRVVLDLGSPESLGYVILPMSEAWVCIVTRALRPAFLWPEPLDTPGA